MLNARGAVQLAAALRGDAAAITDPTRWSRHIVWGNQRVARRTDHRSGQRLARGCDLGRDQDRRRRDDRAGARARTPAARGRWLATAATTLSAEMEFEDEVTLDAWPEELRDFAWAAGQPQTTPLAATSLARDVARRSMAVAAPR